MVLYVYMYVYILVCLWGDHFSEKRVKLNSVCAHYTLIIKKMKAQLLLLKREQTIIIS